MMDLVVLLGIALAMTVAIGLLFAGFMWTPWLIGLLLVVLLVVLMRLTKTNEPLLEETASSEGNLPHSDATATPAAPAAPSESAISAPAMLYRGARYQRCEADSSAQPAPVAESGKYRGHPWKR